MNLFYLLDSEREIAEDVFNELGWEYIDNDEPIIEYRKANEYIKFDLKKEEYSTSFDRNYLREDRELLHAITLQMFELDWKV